MQTNLNVFHFNGYKDFAIIFWYIVYKKLNKFVNNFLHWLHNQSSKLCLKSILCDAVLCQHLKQFISDAAHLPCLDMPFFSRFTTSSEISMTPSADGLSIETERGSDDCAAPIVFLYTRPIQMLRYHQSSVGFCFKAIFIKFI